MCFISCPSGQLIAHMPVLALWVQPAPAHELAVSSSLGLSLSWTCSGWTTMKLTSGPPSTLSSLTGSVSLHATVLRSGLLQRYAIVMLVSCLSVCQSLAKTGRRSSRLHNSSCPGACAFAGRVRITGVECQHFVCAAAGFPWPPLHEPGRHCGSDAGCFQGS